MKTAVLKSLFSAEAVTFPSKWMVEKLAAMVDIQHLFYKVIPNGVNYSEWYSETDLGSQESNQESHIVFAGTLGARKGFVDLIEAVKMLRHNGYPIILTLLGKHSRYAKRILKRERQSITEGNLRAPGAVERGQLKRYFTEADVCCFPSWFETVGIVGLEAMACGGIVVSSANSGMAEAIENERDGFLAPPKAPKELAHIIERVLLMSPEEKVEMRRRARQKILTTFDNSIIAEKILDFYRVVIDNFLTGNCSLNNNFP